MNSLHRKPPFDLLDKQKVRPVLPGGGCAAQWYFIEMLRNFYAGENECTLDLMCKRNRRFPSTPDIAVRRARFALETTFNRHLPDVLEPSAAAKEALALRGTDSRAERVWLLRKAQQVLGHENPLGSLCRSARLVLAQCKKIDETAAGYAAFLLAEIAVFNSDEEDGLFLPFEVFHDMNCIGTPNVRDAFPEIDILFPGFVRRPT